MTNKLPKQRYEIGMIDLFFIGRILILDQVNRSFEAEGFNQEVLGKEPAERNFGTIGNILYFIELLRKRTSLMMIVPASAPVYSIIKDLSEHFQLDDFSITEIQLCLTRLKAKNKSQNNRLKFVLGRK